MKLPPQLLQAAVSVVDAVGVAATWAEVKVVALRSDCRPAWPQAPRREVSVSNRRTTCRWWRRPATDVPVYHFNFKKTKLPLFWRNAMSNYMTGSSVSCENWQSVYTTHLRKFITVLPPDVVQAHHRFLMFSPFRSSVLKPNLWLKHKKYTRFTWKSCFQHFPLTQCTATI